MDAPTSFERSTMQKLDILRRYADRMNRIYTLTGGGELRAARGQLVESLIDDCCEFLGLTVRTGTSDLQTVSIGPHSKQQQVDRHIYKGSKPVCFVEAKAYLDSCYYERACYDFKVLKLAHPGVPCILVSLENSLSSNSIVFTDAVFEHTCDRIFFLCDGKRSSSRPLYKKEHAKPILETQLDELLDYLRSVKNV